MNYLKDAQEQFDCDEKDLKPFSVVDTFNNNNLEGYLCNIGDYRYGSLYIYKVNETKHPQVIWGTPKIPYPFDKRGNFNFPKCLHIYAYEKLDGTNILAYKYTNGKDTFVTYKTRLTPIVRSSRFGDFKSMWERILKKYPEIPQLALKNDFNWSFELYAAENKHLMIYDTPLDTRLLFGIKRGSPDVIAPHNLPSHSIPHTKVIEFKGSKDIVSFYKKIQAESEAGNNHTEMGVEGTEGYVFYTLLENYDYKMFKCKPHDIEKIHWASGGIHKNAIRATVFNAYENTDDVTFDFVKQLLLEEYPPEIIDKSLDKIKKIMEEVKNDIQIRTDVFDLYKSLGLDITKDKIGTMRELSKHFEKKQIRYVYWIITHYEEGCVSE